MYQPQHGEAEQQQQPQEEQPLPQVSTAIAASALDDDNAVIAVKGAPSAIPPPSLVGANAQSMVASSALSPATTSTASANVRTNSGGGGADTTSSPNVDVRTVSPSNVAGTGVAAIPTHNSAAAATPAMMQQIPVAPLHPIQGAGVPPPPPPMPQHQQQQQQQQPISQQMQQIPQQMPQQVPQQMNAEVCNIPSAPPPSMMMHEMNPYAPPAPQQGIQQQQMYDGIAQQQPQQPVGDGVGYQPPKVEDALSYLEQVKVQFRDQPPVYNQFLDIMKEFKRQSIDTTTVIGRVSTLFEGHPDLIRGFHTFLPPGYKIQVQQYAAAAAARGAMNAAPQAMMHPGGGPSGIGRPMVPGGVGPLMNGPPGDSSRQGKQPVEFNHAINYVNKIKQRFHAQPEIYKAFLEILHTYQKDQQSNKENPILQVYGQVANLFARHPDLLEEFSQFLPEAIPAAQAHAAQRNVEAQPANDDFNGYPDCGPPPKKVQKRGGSGVHRGGRGGGGSGGAAPSNSNMAMSYRPDKKFRAGTREITLAEAARVTTLEDYMFFDKMKATITNPRVYDNFLKSLNLFTLNVVNKQELVHMVSNFLGKFPEQFSWFKQFVGYRSINTNDVSEMPLDERPMPAERGYEIDYSTCKRLGCSYRALPADFPPPKCTGREHDVKAGSTICDDVLNDHWVSFPTWSEDSAFVSSRKNIHEEALFKCEDERYELDMILEANLSTVRALEPVARKLAGMSHEQASKFRLGNTLGSGSESIPRKAIKRLYGDRYHEVIDGLKKKPAVAVPIVLKRLKQKDEDWRKAQREWNRTWREVNEKNYLKSLDYQGLTFKANDKKAMAAKALVAEMELLQQEQRERAVTATTIGSVGVPVSEMDNVVLGANAAAVAAINGDDVPLEAISPRIVFRYDDVDIFDDVNDLIRYYYSRSSASQSSQDKEAIEKLLDGFFASFFGLKGSVSKTGRGEVKAYMTNDDAAMDTSLDEGTATYVKPLSVKQQDDDFSIAAPKQSSSTSLDTHVFYCKNAWYALFRLHQMLYERMRNLKRVASETEARERRAHAQLIRMHAKANVGKSDDPVAITLSQKSGTRGYGAGVISIPLVPPIATSGKPSKSASAISMTEIRTSVGSDAPVPTPTPQQQNNNGSDEDADGETPTNAPSLDLDKCGGYYPAFLKLVRLLIDNHLDPGAYEDVLREMFTVYAYPAYSMDKLVQTFVRQLQVVYTDETCLKLLSLYEYDNARMKPDPSLDISARSNTEAMIGDSNCYCLSYDIKHRVLTIDLLDESEVASAPDPDSVSEKWSAYVDRYVRQEETDPELTAAVKRTFLERNRRLFEKSSSTKPLEVRNALECKVCVNSYHMLYVDSSSDYLYRRGSRNPLPVTSKLKGKKGANNSTKRGSLLSKWLAAHAKPDAEEAERFALLTKS